MIQYKDDGFDATQRGLAIQDINEISKQKKKEYAGWVYQNEDGTWSYTKPNEGTKAESKPGSFPKGKKHQSVYHTHGAADEGYDNENFSEDDKDLADALGEPIYVGTPGGLIKKYTPGKRKRRGETTVIGRA